MGLARDATGSFGVGLLILASGMLVAGITLLLLGRDRQYLHAPGRQAAE
jgi:hypothetical protein